MASTNKTTNYELSQYIGTDKPTYLTDYNQDMSKIDAGIHAAKSEADNNTTSIGTLSSLTTTAKTDLVSALNEVDADVATNTNNIATNTSNISTNTTHIGTLTNLTTSSKTDLVVAANEINAKVGDLSSLDTTSKSSVVSAINEINTKSETAESNIEKFNLTSFTSYNGSQMTGTGIQSYSNITVATNSDGSIGKVYGSIFVVTSSEAAMTVTIPSTALRPTSNITINNAGLTIFGGSGLIGESMQIQTNGNIVFTLYNVSGATQRHTFMPCLYFMKDFGDTPTPQ